MSYTKTNWVNDETPVNATNMNKIESTLDALWPKVGDIEINVSGTNPSTKYSGTTWIQFGTGKTLVGFNNEDEDFDTVEETGGAKGAWRHNHDHSEWVFNGSSASGVHYGFSWQSNTGVLYTNSSAGGQGQVQFGNYANGSTNNTLDVDKANMPPYIVVYFWKCTSA